MSKTIHSHRPHPFKAFTLVELLVVIGVIALLISILMPALGKARQQANLVSCQANLRSIGQLMAIYTSDNRGFLPYGKGAIGLANGGYMQTWTWADTVTLVNRTDHATIQTAANGWWPPVPQASMSLDYLPIFHDSDLVGDPFASRASSYNGHPRLLPDDARVDPITNGNSKVRPMGTIKNASSTMLLWDGSVTLWNGQNLGTLNMSDTRIDNGEWTWGHGFCNPPYQNWYSLAQYATPVALGQGSSGASSSWPGSVTKSVLMADNVDGTAQYFNLIGLRYRHLNNTTANGLFVDGHVESRGLGGVLAGDICVNQ